jgi:hypothetical protein
MVQAGMLLWPELTLNTARDQFGAGGASATSGIIFGGKSLHHQWEL